MTENLSTLVAANGAGAVFVATFLACLILPIPASLIMLAAGAYAASGDLDLRAVLGGALRGASLGDQAGFFSGRRGGPWILARLSRRPRMAGWVLRAEERLALRPAWAVFFSRWLVSPLGPYVNLAAGAARVSWRRFTLPAILGKGLWVALYVGLGYALGARAEAVGGTVTGAVTTLGVALIAVLLARALWRRRRRQRQPPERRAEK